MEGIPAWWLLAGFAIYAWMVLSALPLLVALGFFVAGRKRTALILLSAGLFSEAIAWSFFCLAVCAVDGLGLPLPILSVALFLAGAAQFIAALRNTRMYVPTFALGLAALGVIASGTPMRYQLIELLRLPDAFHKLPEWHSLPIALCSLALACASMLCAFHRASPTQASKEATLAKWFSAVKGEAVDLVLAGRVFGGRPGESSQQPMSYSYDGHILIIHFATTEILNVEQPSDFLVSKTGDLIIPQSKKATFGWHSYGRPQTPENWCEELVEGARIELVRWGKPRR